MTDEEASQKGIDIRKALDILSARSAQPDSEHHTHTDGCCHTHPDEVPTNAKSMGQTIDMLRENHAEVDEKAVEEAEALQKRVQEEREKRKLEMEQKIRSMSVKELIQCILEAQEQRVRAYTVYNG